jgi:hypothetical protein
MDAAMAEFRVVCVDHGLFPGSPGSKIIRFGIKTGSAPFELLDKDILMNRMTRGDRFYVIGGGLKAYLQTATSPQGHTFVETVGDSTLLDNLGSLPVCTVNDVITYGTGVNDPNDVDGGSDGGPDNPSGGGDVDQPDDPYKPS